MVVNIGDSRATVRAKMDAIFASVGVAASTDTTDATTKFNDIATNRLVVPLPGLTDGLAGGTARARINAVEASIAAGGAIHFPTIVPFSFTGTGAPVNVALGFRPDLIIVKDASTGYAWFFHEWCWKYRRPFLARPVAHIDDWGMFTDTGFTDGIASNGVVYHGVAIKDNGSGLLEVGSWHGNGVAGRKLTTGIVPAYIGVKRDNNYSFWSRDTLRSTSHPYDATASAGHIASLLPDGATLDASEDTNAAVTTINAGGEGYDYFAVAESAYSEILSYVGTGATKAIGGKFVPVAALVKNQNGGTPRAGHIATETMGANSGSMMGSYATGAIDLSANSLGASSQVNEAGQTHSALLLKRSDTIYAAPAAKSFAALRIDAANGGAIVPRNPAFDFVSPSPFSLEMIFKPGAGTTALRTLVSLGRANSSAQQLWGLLLETLANDETLAWRGSNTGPVTQNLWYGPKFMDRLHHLVFTYDGANAVEIAAFGKVIKQSAVPRAIQQSADPAGNRVGIGCRRDTADARVDGATNASIALLRIYNSALSRAQITARYRRGFLGESVADVTPLEEWDAANISGSTWVATISSTNNAAIANATVVSL